MFFNSALLKMKVKINAQVVFHGEVIMRSNMSTNVHRNQNEKSES